MAQCAYVGVASFQRSKCIDPPCFRCEMLTAYLSCPNKAASPVIRKLWVLILNILHFLWVALFQVKIIQPLRHLVRYILFHSFLRAFCLSLRRSILQLNWPVTMKNLDIRIPILLPKFCRRFRLKPSIIGHALTSLITLYFRSFSRCEQMLYHSQSCLVFANLFAIFLNRLQILLCLRVLFQTLSSEGWFCCSFKQPMGDQFQAGQIWKGEKLSPMDELLSEEISISFIRLKRLRIQINYSESRRCFSQNWHFILDLQSLLSKHHSSSEHQYQHINFMDSQRGSNRHEPLYQKAISYLQQNQGWKVIKLIGEGYSSRIYSLAKGETSGERQLKFTKAAKITVLPNGLDPKKKTRLIQAYRLENLLLKQLGVRKGVNTMEEGGECDLWMYFIMPYYENGTLLSLLPATSDFIKIKPTSSTNERNQAQLELQLLEPNHKIHSSPQTNQFLIDIQAYSEIVRQVLYQIISVLAQVHSKGVIHRDIKLSNILFDSDYNIVLIDFGMASLSPKEVSQDYFCSQIFSLNQSLNGKGQFLTGTREYLSPQLLGGKSSRVISTKIDIWALGVVAYQLFSHGLKVPFVGTTKSELNCHIRDGEPDYENFPIPLGPDEKQLMEKCFIKDPVGRFSAKELMSLAYFKSIHFAKAFYFKSPLLRLLYPEKFVPRLLTELNMKDNVIYWKLKPKADNSDIEDIMKETNSIVIKFSQDTNGFQWIQVIKSSQMNSAYIIQIQLSNLQIQREQQSDCILKMGQENGRCHWVKFKSAKNIEEFMSALKSLS